MQIEQIDIDAVNAFHAQSFEALFRSTGPAKRPINEAHRLLVEAFARHRHQARAEVVGEIVAWLLSDASRLAYEESGSTEFFGWWAADKIKAEFGGRGGS